MNEFQETPSSKPKPVQNNKLSPSTVLITTTALQAGQAEVQKPPLQLPAAVESNPDEYQNQTKKANEILKFWSVLQPGQKLNVQHVTETRHGRKQEFDQVTVLDESDTPIEGKTYSIDALVSDHERKLTLLQKERQTQRETLAYLYARNYGVSLEDRNITLEYDNASTSEAVVVTPGGKLITYTEAIKNLNANKPAFEICLKNLQLQHGSKRHAFETYINHDTRFGRAAAQVFSERGAHLVKDVKTFEAVKQQALVSHRPVDLLRFGVLALKQPLKRPLSYFGAIIKSATSLVIYDWNPLRILGEKTLGRAWTHKFNDGKSLREYAARLEEKLMVDPITKAGVRSGAISEKRVYYFGQA